MTIFNPFLFSFFQVAEPPCPSQSTDSGVGATRRRFLEHENAGPSFSHSTILNEDSVVPTEDIDVKPDLSDLSNSAQLPTTNGSGKRELKRRSRHDDEEDLEFRGPPVVTKSQNVEEKLKALKKRKVPPVSTLEPPEESSSEDEKPIRYFVCVSVIHSIISFLIYLFLCLI